MKMSEALALHNEDEVTVRRSNEIREVLETRVTTLNNKKYVELLLDDGNWYNHRQVK